MPRREQRSPSFTDACVIYGDEFASEQIEPARQILEVETIDVVADKGYFKSEDIEACEKAGLTPHVPRPQRGTSGREGFSARTSSASTLGATRISVLPGRR
jgi:IS5 family transposase